VQIRNATYADLPRILEIERLSFPQPWSLNSFRRELTLPFSRIIVASQVADGPADAFMCRWLVADELHILNIAVHPAERHSGIGTRLMEEAIGEAKAKRTELINLALYRVLCGITGEAPRRPSRRQVANASVIGCVLLIGGTGLVGWAEQTVDSHLAALIVSSTPLWVTLFDSALRRTVPASPPQVLGMALGVAGVAILTGAGGGSVLRPGAGVVLLLLATLFWSIASSASHLADLPSNAVLTSAIQMTAAGAVFALSDLFVLLVLVALTGTLSTDPNESGPITSLEQAMLGGAPAEERARVFGRYNAVAYLAGALGALAGGGPALFRHLFPALAADQRWLLVFPVVAIACVWLAGGLSARVEADGRAPARPLERSRGTVMRLAALFGLDAFAGGFVVTTFIVYWFDRRFGASPETMGAVLFAGGLIQAGSSMLSGRLAGRIGLLNTMVFTHLPSNVLLAVVPLMPMLPLAIAVLLLRFTLSQMDVPARQAYVVAMVDPAERTAAAAFTNTARYVVRPFGALGAGVAMQAVAVGAPFVIAGCLKAVYDLALYATFRRVPLPGAGGVSPRPSA